MRVRLFTMNKAYAKISLKITVAFLLLFSAVQISKAGGDFTGFNKQFPGKHSYKSKAKAPDGSLSERFEVRSGDCTGTEQDCATDRERAERFEAPPYSKLNREYWYTYKIYFPEDFEFTPPVNNLFGQFHQRGKGVNIVNIGMHGGQPEGYYFELIPFEEGPGLVDTLLISNTELREKWHTIVVNAKWSNKSDAFVKVWVNGVKKVDYKGPNINRNTPVYFKYGAYRAYVSRYGSPLPTQVVYYRDVRRGNAEKDLKLSVDLN